MPAACPPLSFGAAGYRDSEETCMTLQSILVLIGLIAVLAFAIVWIAKQGGWQDRKCGGNCISCMAACEKRQQPPTKS